MSIDTILHKLDEYAKFSERFRENEDGMRLGNHQLVPIYDAVENGLKRFLLAYATGAGKTLIPMHILKHLKRKDSRLKTLVISPNQTMQENWNDELARRNGLSLHMHRIEGKKSSIIPSNADFVVVNYDKMPTRFSYLQSILNYCDGCGLVILDECHNVKNRYGEVSKAVQCIIEETKDKRLIALSASPCPDKLSDMGMILYMLDPVRYAHYRTIPFRVQDDPEAIWEMRENGLIRFFDRDAVARFYGLPNLTIHEPIDVDMHPRFEKRYFEAFKDCFEMGKVVHLLERISIEAMIASPDTQAFLEKKISEGYALNFFSHLRNNERHRSTDTAIFRLLEAALRKLGAKDIRQIHGDVGKHERKKIQHLMRDGHIDALINQWKCSKEGFSEVAGNRKVLIVPLCSPFSPGDVEQILGRSYRPGQQADVEYVEFHPESPRLKERMDKFIREFAEEHGLTVRSNWLPSLFHKDAYNIRKGKEKRTIVHLYQRSYFEMDDNMFDIDSINSYAHLLSRQRILDTSKREGTFGSGTRAVIKYVGTKYSDGLRDNAEPLGNDYDKEDILLYAPGKINLFLAKSLDEIKGKHVSWKIADLGCCSTAVFCQARLFWQALKGDTDLDHIVNVDGQAGFINTARNHIESKRWCEAIKKIDMDGITKEQLEMAYGCLRKTDFTPFASFIHADFTEQEFGTNYDAVITSQCLQYNDQNNYRDIEKIILNINQSLKMGGHYICVLTGNSFNRSFTKPQDIENFTRIISDYGFRLASYSHLQGKNGGKVVLKPFHFIHAVKEEDIHNLTDIVEIPKIYTQNCYVLTGGYRTENLKSNGKKETIITPLPTSFVDAEGKDFRL